MVFEQRTVSPYWFILPLSAIYLTAILLIQRLPLLATPDAISMGITLDLVILVPFIYYVVMVRGRGWPTLSIMPVFLLSYFAAYTLLPDSHHHTLNMIGFLIPMLEVGIVGYAGYQVFRLVRSGRQSNITEGDFYENLRSLLTTSSTMATAMGALAYEISIFYYAFRWRSTPLPNQSISYRKESGYGAVFGVILLVATVELVGVHFLLSLWSQTAVIVHILLSVYAIIWLIGDFRAMHNRPHLLEKNSISLRLGLRWEIQLSYNQIDEIITTKRSPSDDPKYLGLTPLNTINTLLVLDEPVEASGPYGFKKSVTRVGLLLSEDDLAELKMRTSG